jgi:hypothetical protein
MIKVHSMLTLGLAVLVATTIVSGAQDRPISGTVHNPQGKPIGNIALILASTTHSQHESEDTVRLITVNADGSFTGSVPEGDYRIVGTSPSCFSAHDLSLVNGDNLKLVLEWRAKPASETTGEVGGTTANFRIGFSAGPTNMNLLRVGNLAGGLGLSTRGIGAGVGLSVTRTPNGGGIAVDPEPDCQKWKSTAQ